MNVTYNFSEYCHKGEKEFNNNSCKAVRTTNGDLFIISNGMDDTNSGKEVADIVVDNIISYLSKDVFSNKQEALENSFDFAKQQLEANFDLHLDYKNIKIATAVLLFDNDQFHIATTGDTNVSLFSNGKLHPLTKENELLNWDVFSPKDPIKLKKDDVLIASSNELSATLTNAAINTIFNNSASVAQKTKDLLDKVVSEGGKNNISIQTIEITNSDHLQTVFVEETASNIDEFKVETDTEEVTIEESIVEKEPVEFKEEVVEEIVEEKAIFEPQSDLATASIIADDTKLEEPAKFTTEDTFENQFEEDEDDDDDYDEDDEDEEKGVSLSKFLYLLIPLFLFLAYKYYPLLLSDKNTDEVTTTVDGTTSQDGDSTMSNDSINVDDPNLYPDATDPNATSSDTTNTTQNNTVDTTNTTTVSESYFVIGNNDFENNTYKTIYQFIKNSGTSLSMDDIIKLNPDYRKKRDGDKVYLK